MDVFSMEMGILLSFVKTSEFRGGGGLKTPKPPSRYATDSRYIHKDTNVINSVFCLTKGPRPLPNRVPHTVRSSASSVNLHYTYKAETCSCILRCVAYYIVILSDKLLCF